MACSLVSINEPFSKLGVLMNLLWEDDCFLGKIVLKKKPNKKRISKLKHTEIGGSWQGRFLC